MRSSLFRRAVFLLAFALSLLVSFEARAQLALGGTGAGSQQQKGRRSYGPPSARASFLYWDLTLTGGLAFLFSAATVQQEDGTTPPPTPPPSSGPAGTVFGRVGPQLALVHRRAVFALRPTYEISNFSWVTLGGELHIGAIPGGNSYIGVFGGPLFDLDGRLDAGRTGVMPRSGFHAGLSVFLLGFEYCRRSYPREELYAEDIFGLTLTLSYAFFETTVGFPPLPGRLIARFDR